MQTLVTYDLMVLAFGSIAFGFYLLVKGGDWAIDAAVFFADKAGLSKLFVGATILAFGTSIPELFASVNANLSGFPGISLGNVIGSNIANILLVLGVTAIVFPVICKPEEVRADIVMMLVASVALCAAMQFNVVARGTGVFMFIVLLGFVAYQYKASLAATLANQIGASLTETEQLNLEAEAEVNPIFKTNLSALGFLLGGFGALAVGSELLVKGAVTIGTVLGVPEAIIGTTVIAFGTSLPELATCILAAVKKHTEVIAGNILGSNVFNILSIVGITAMIKPIGVDPNLTGLSLWLMLIVAVLISIWFLLGKALTKPMGILMLLCYTGYVSVQYL